MKTRLLFWVALPLSAGVLSYFATTGQLQRSWSAAFRLYPVIDYPEQLDLGEHEIGDLIIAPFTISNRGGGELVIDQVQTNCSCTGLEQRGEAGYLRVESLRLQAGEHAELVMRIAVRGVPNDRQMVNLVRFRTNDPTRPEAQIEAVVSRVRGGVTCFPRSIAFGTVPIGAKVVQTVDVRDTGQPPRSIERLTSTDPDRVTFRLLPIPTEQRNKNWHPDGVLIARFEVVVNTATSGQVTAKAEIHLKGGTRSPDGLDVAGRIAEPIEVTPSSLLLPRVSADGLIYTANCIVRSTDGQALTAVVEQAPPGLTAEALPGEAASLRRIRVRWDPRGGKALAGTKNIVHLKVKTGPVETRLQLPVLIRDEGR